ncbi:MAG: hypothetical protein FJW39_11580 [Acidobacteria bacterium]|nr:hypothetical protein [Acidobacteriota bacterium]
MGEVLEIVRELPSREQQELALMLLGRSPEEEQRRRALIWEMFGKYAGVLPSSEDFCKRKAEEVLRGEERP